MASVVCDACASILMTSWFYNSRIGTDCACCDTCCRCTCCDDKGELPDEERHQQGAAAHKTAKGNTAAEDTLPRYEESPGMKIPHVESAAPAEQATQAPQQPTTNAAAGQ